MNVPNAETIEAIEEAKRISKDRNVKSYSSVKELFEDLNNEIDAQDDE